MDIEKKQSWWRRPKVFRSLIATGFIAVSVVVILFAPEWLVDLAAAKDSDEDLTIGQRVTAINFARQGVLFVIGGLIAVFTLLLTLAKHDLDRRGQELDREGRALDRRGRELDQDANWTTRYTEAIRLLGDRESFAIRLGGIYALERIAQDSQRDRQTILDVLWAYLLAESPLKTETGVDTMKMESHVAAAATAAGRITQLSPPKHRAILSAAKLTGANLTKADLTGADLTGANLSNANLTGANLTNANLTNAYFSNADLTNADLTGADLTGANLSNANLADAFTEMDRGTRILVTKRYLLDQEIKGLGTVKGMPTDESPAVP